jgi:hypothetical protein
VTTPPANGTRSHLNAVPHPDHEPPPDDDYNDGPPAANEPPHDLPAEQAVLGSMLLSTQAITDTTDTLYGTEFYRHAHELIYHAIIDVHLDGAPVDLVTVAAHLQEQGDLTRAGGAPYLHNLVRGVVSPASAGYYAQIIRDRAARRALTTAGLRITQLGQATTAGDFDDLARAATQALEQATADHAATAAPVRAQHIDDFLTGETTYDWVVPHVLERGDRLIVTAGEGHGKSTLLRQVAVQLATGIHPFTLGPTPPIRVLLVDLENSERQTRRQLAPLRTQAGTALDDPDRLRIICKPDGLDLTTPTDEKWLSDLLARHTPDLLITGPLYKLAGGNPNDEKDAKPAAMALDRLRTTHGCALLLEAHSRKAENGDPTKRPKEPFGWSGWMRWPEFGLHLAQDGTLTHWRGGRDERAFPPALNRGGTWPWTPDTAATRGDTELRWLQIQRAITEAGRKLTDRELQVATGISRSTIQRVLGSHALQYGALLATVRGAEGTDDDTD